MVRAVTSALDKKWDSLFLGKTLMQYTGGDGLFRRAEHQVSGMPVCAKPDADATEGINDLFRFLDEEVAKLLHLEEQERRTIIQYMVYAKAYEDGAVDYDRIYRTRYIR